MSKNKKQHYIPKRYLKAWCDPNCPANQTPYIWIFEKESKEGKKKSPGNTFHQTDMYAIWDDQGQRNLNIEHGLGGLEDQFSTIRNKKFNFRRDLDRAEKLIIEVFIAAMHARTKKQLKHLSDQWKHPLKMMDQLAEQMKTATEEEKRNFAKMSPPSSNSKRDSLTHEQVRKIVEDPVSTLLLPLIRAEAPLLGNLDFSILCTDTSPGFITSDSPCVWFDPKSCTRPPLYQAPALMYETIEISLPVSPKICILLNRQGSTGYQDVPEIVVSEINRRTRFYASEYYVTSQNVTDSYWFDPGKAPDDSWDNRNKPSGCNSSRRLG